MPRGSIRENQRAYAEVALDLTTFTFDADLDPNRGPYRYRLLNGTDTFRVGASSGLVQAARQLDREDIPRYILALEVSDNGHPALTTVARVTVDVGDENDNGATARPLDIHVYSPGGATGVVGDVRPLDVDEVGAYTCRITGGGGGAFVIESGCELRLRATSSQNDVRLTMSGGDGRHPAVTYPVNVHLHPYDGARIAAAAVTLQFSLTAPQFLERHFSGFVAALGRRLSDGDELVTVGLAEGAGGRAQMTLAVRRGDVYVMRAAATRWLSAELDRVVLEMGVGAVQIVRCPAMPGERCLNGGTCVVGVSVGGELVPVNTRHLVVTSAGVSVALRCDCAGGYSGGRCELPPARCSACAHGGVCCPLVGCVCTAEWTGARCDVDVDECEASPCRHGGTCRNAPGGFRCDCPPGRPDCAPAPDPAPEAPPTCPLPPRSFSPLSYAAFHVSLRPTSRVAFEFRTSRMNALLLYQSAATAGFIAVEVVDGHVRFSFAGDANPAVHVTVMRSVADGNWHRLEIERIGKVGGECS